MENKINCKNTERRRNSNCNARYERSLSRIGTSFGQPVHVGFYLNSMLDRNGSIDRKKIVELFNTESYG